MGAEKGGIRTEIKRSDEEHIHAVDGGNLVHRLKSLLGLNLDHGQESVVGLLEVLGKGRNGVEALEGDGGAEAATANGRELGRLDELPSLLRGPEKRDDDLLGGLGQNVSIENLYVALLHSAGILW